MAGQGGAIMSEPYKIEMPAWHRDLDAMLDRYRASVRVTDDALRSWQASMEPIQAKARQWQDSMRAVQEAASALVRQFEVNLAPLVTGLEPFFEQHRLCERVEEAGWLPHRITPFEIVQAADSIAAIDEAMHRHYRDGWPQVAADLTAGLAALDIDDEAKSTFGEALAAHDAGLYRCAPRLLYPEIERVARIEIHGGAFDKMASQHRLKILVSELSPADLASTGVPGMRFYRVLTQHLYAHMKDDTARELATANAVPNRHAALHGIVSYVSEKSSLNAILAADYLFQAIAAVKRRAEEIADADLGIKSAVASPAS
jgi:hypothetical protein